MVRAKFMLTKIGINYGASRNVEFTPQYDPNLPEDQRFCKATPSGKFEMLIDNPAALAQLELGKQYYLDLSPAPDEPKPAT